jgi:hypothetical protein
VPERSLLEKLPVFICAQAREAKNWFIAFELQVHQNTLQQITFRVEFAA